VELIKVDLDSDYKAVNVGLHLVTAWGGHEVSGVQVLLGR
jgi:hypothetical protein